MVHPNPGHNRHNYPEWSWDHVRTYVSVAHEQVGAKWFVPVIILFSNPLNTFIQQVAVRRKDAFSDEQIRALASQDIVMLEKMTGHETIIREWAMHLTYFTGAPSRSKQK